MTGAAALARLTQKRLLRSRGAWVSVLILFLPAAYALVIVGEPDPAGRWEQVVDIALRAVIVVPILHLAGALGDEIEARTASYLWSRPITRAALVLGKLGGVLPLVIIGAALAVACAWGVVAAGPGGARPEWLATGVLAASLGAAASGAFAAGLGALVPRYPLVAVLTASFVVEQGLSSVDSVQAATALYHARALALLGWPGSTEGAVAALLGLALVFGFWLAVAVWRARRLQVG